MYVVQWLYIAQCTMHIPYRPFNQTYVQRTGQTSVYVKCQVRCSFLLQRHYTEETSESRLLKYTPLDPEQKGIHKYSEVLLSGVGARDLSQPKSGRKPGRLTDPVWSTQCRGGQPGTNNANMRATKFCKIWELGNLESKLVIGSPCFLVQSFLPKGRRILWV